ncbi:hypothetical protein LTR99_000559 [Exophiala xenobiotica]|uniref:Cytochrome c oxidase assembly factor 3 n=1 Tax=Vermiconidia calcicola TaxID=1690605 RepID=A0AAV9QHQ6_9PEZI|nr:hypothetical protein H2202_003734 [Exophiala xenobiotica]KAK5543617.1 hypothetical protein LTR25_001231 [Vermiconidia calcicola]KAK5197084.1 hypothetical protein LTR92_003022 [Exophiala xenobiotica]KAK5213457.1 hypothetical protein LTR41_001036 [Exophiala xenobiotica]KAK5231132.1 hypothetical protein LTR72_000312 [Exophiala xenobiotica]
MHSTLPLRRGILKRSSYYNPDYRTGAALNRARRPYLFKNMVTGVAIFSFAIGVCTQALRTLFSVCIYRHHYPLTLAPKTVAFTLRAVGQDRFEDVIVPDAPGAQPAQPSPKPGTSAVNGMRS